MGYFSKTVRSCPYKYNQKIILKSLFDHRDFKEMINKNGEAIINCVALSQKENSMSLFNLLLKSVKQFKGNSNGKTVLEVMRYL